MPNANSKKIDIHTSGNGYESRLNTLKKDKDVSPENKKLIIDFLNDAELGKTNQGRAKKKVGELRLKKYLSVLTRLSEWFNKPFDKLTLKDVEKVISNLEKGVYKKRKVIPQWEKGELIGLKKIDTKETFAKDTVLDFKKSLKKFFKWLFKDDLKKYSELTGWIETFEELNEVPALSREEVEKMANACDTKWRALVMLLFDSGTRIEEALNVRIGDISRKKSGETNTESFYIRIKHSKTKPRTISIPMSTKALEGWLSIHPDKDNPDAQLFPLTYASVLKNLHVIGKKALKKNVYPHLLRHSSATYYCNKLNQYQLCYRYGWSMASRQPQRYIDREGINEEETVKKYTEDEVENLKRENKKLNEDMTNVTEQLSKLSEYLPILRTIESSRKIIGILNKEMKVKK